MLINLQIYFLAIAGNFCLTLALVPLIQKIAERFNILDQPDDGIRKIHQHPVPLLGGLAIFLTTFFWLFLFRFFKLANFVKISDRTLIGIFIAGAIIMLGGFLDDKFRLKPYQQIIWPALAVVAAFFAGLKIGFITNPLGGSENGIIYLVPAIGGAVAIFWLLGMAYTTKLLDGLDGLVASISAIASLFIFFLSLDWDVPRSATGIWALMLFGSCLAFLFFNWHPAKIFLGEGGSLFLGFMLGVLSIISGSKIAATLLVVGIPILDVAWVILRRLFKKESPFFHADRKHLHFQFLDLGLSQPTVVLIFCLFALAFGGVAVFLPSFGKLIGFISLVFLMAIILMVIYSIKKWKEQKL